MLVYQIEMLIAIEEPHREERCLCTERVDPGLDAHGIRTPIGAQQQEVPATTECGDTRDELRRDLRAGTDRALEGDELGLGRRGEPRLVGLRLLETIEERGHP